MKLVFMSAKVEKIFQFNANNKKKVVPLQAKTARTGCTSAKEQALCTRFAPSLQAKMAIWWLMPPDERESGESPELCLQL
jgi:hypothetical protein